MTCADQEIKVIQGESERVLFTLLDSAGAALDLTGALVTWRLVLIRGAAPTLEFDTDNDPTSITISDAAAGEVTLSLTIGEVEALAVATYLYSLEVYLPGPPESTKTPIRGAPFQVIAALTS